MRKYQGTKYRSAWDAFTWGILLLTAVLCGVPLLLDGDVTLLPVIICTLSFLFVLITFLSVYYRIDGDMLIVYAFFIPKEYPISKIASIKPTTSVLSSPAASLRHRIAITFTDRRVLKSSIPLIISPVRQDDFIAELRAVNPDITTD